MLNIRIFLIALLTTLATNCFATEIKAELKDVFIANQTSIFEGNLKTFEATTTSDVSIIDEFPPFYWQGKGVGAKYLQDVKNLMIQFKISEFKFDIKDPMFVQQEKNVAYAVFPITITYKDGDMKIHTEEGYQPAVFKKSKSNKWLIQSTAWAVTTKVLK